MKKPFIFLLLLGLTTFTRAQSDTAFFEIGINAFRLVDRIGNSNTKNINPYLFTAEYSFGKIGLRAGAGIDRFSRKDLPAPVNGNTTLTADSSYSDFRFGLVYYKNLTSRWSMKAGIDYVTGTDKGSIETSFPDPNGKTITNLVEFERKESGVSPFVFLQYHFSSRVSIGTEILCNITSWKRTESSKNSEFPSTNTNKEQEGKSFVIQAPSALFLSIRF